MAFRSKRWGQVSCTPGERVTMCSCISVGPRPELATGPSAVATVAVSIGFKSEPSIEDGAGRGKGTWAIGWNAEGARGGRMASGAGGALLSPRRVAFRASTLARHETLVLRFA